MSKPHFEHEPLPANWASLEQRFKAAPMLRPEAGFGRRWLARQQADTQRTLVRRAWGLALLNGTATLFLALVLLQGFAPLVAEPGSTLAAIMEAAAELAVSLLTTLNVAVALLNRVPEATWLLIGTGAMSLMLAATLLLTKVGLIKGDVQ